MSDEELHGDLGDQDVEQTLFRHDDRDKLLQDKKNMTREKLITMLIEAHKNYAKVELEKTAAVNEKVAAVNEKKAAIIEKTTAINEKSVMEKEHQEMMDNMLSAQQELQLEQDVTKKLMKRIDALEGDEDGERPVVGLITDNTAKVVFKYIDGPSCIWRMINIDKLSMFANLWENDQKFRTVLSSFDTVVIMLGLSDIKGGSECYQVISQLLKMTQTLTEAEIPFIVSQILPSQDLKYGVNIKILNRKICDSKHKFKGIEIEKSVFNNKYDADNFDENDNVKDSKAKQIAKILVGKVGTPAKREPKKCDEPDETVNPADDSTEYTEFISVLPRYKGPIIGRDGDNVEAIQASTGTRQILAMEYRTGEGSRIKHGILITGSKSSIQLAKDAIASVISDWDKRSSTWGNDQSSWGPRGVGQPSWSDPPKMKKGSNPKVFSPERGVALDDIYVAMTVINVPNVFKITILLIKPV